MNSRNVTVEKLNCDISAVQLAQISSLVSLELVPDNLAKLVRVLVEVTNFWGSPTLAPARLMASDTERRL